MNDMKANTGWAQSRRKNPGFFQAFQSDNYASADVITTISLAIWQHFGDVLPYFHRACAEMDILTEIYGAGSLLPRTTMILFTQSTLVLCKYSIVLKLFYLL